MQAFYIVLAALAPGEARHTCQLLPFSHNLSLSPFHQNEKHEKYFRGPFHVPFLHKPYFQSSFSKMTKIDPKKNRWNHL